jgi:DNA polymerase III delta subunit
MKIILIHGEHTLKAYERLQKLISVAKGRGWDIRRVGKAGELPEKTVASGLFEEENIVVVKNAKNLSKDDIKWLNKNKDKKVTILIHNPGLLTKTFIKKLPSVEKNEEYKLTKKIWTFLDSFFPGNAKAALTMFHEVIEKDAPEFVFALLARQLRDVYWVKKDAKTMSLPGWRIGKLKRQAGHFSEKKLKEIISQMAEIDVKVKTSKANLVQSLDFLIISQLE